MTTGAADASGRPSWAVKSEGKGCPKGTALAFESRPGALVAAVVGVVVLAAGEAVHVIGRDELRPALRGFLVAVIAAQVALGWLALRRSPAAVMVLLLCVATALPASLAGGLNPGRVAAAALAAAVLVLLARSLRWFPGSSL